MSYCADCGSELESGAEFCSDCGSKVTGAGTDKEISSETSVDESEQQHPGEEGIHWSHALSAGLLAILPAVILSIVLPIQSLKVIGLLGGIVVFGYLGYQRPTKKSMFGRLSFWTAVILFLSPLGMILNAFVFASQEAQGTAEQAGAAIGGTVLVVLAFVIGIPLGIAFYLLYQRYDIDK